MTTLKLSAVHTHCFQLLPLPFYVEHIPKRIGPEPAFVTQDSASKYYALCKLEMGTHLHGHIINSCALHMHGAEAGRAMTTHT